MSREWQVHETIVRLVQGDITNQSTDAVVNAANKRLAPGGGVAGAIHRAAGPDLWEHCKGLDGCQTGEAVITPGFDLPAPKIIHTVGPVYNSHPQPADALRDSYRNSLQLAVDNDLTSIAFPALSTGAFGYPIEPAAEIALTTTREFLEEKDGLDAVNFVLFGSDDYEVFQQQAEKILA